MAEYHEPVDKLDDRAMDISRALNSLKEEIEAISWYEQRIKASGDDSLKDLLSHNRNEEIEHACMLLEWLRRNAGGWDEHLNTYLFTEGEITDLESDESPAIHERSLNIGKP